MTTLDDPNTLSVPQLSTGNLLNSLINIHGHTSTVVIGAIIAFTLISFLSPKHDPREPPLAPSPIPIFGHVLGFLFNRFNYFDKLSDRLQLPIFTICMPGRRIYVVTKPELISRVDKLHKAISFAPIISEFSSVTCGTSQEATDILNQNLFGEHGNWGLVEDMVVGMRETLKPGTMLDDMNRVMAQEVSELLEAVKPGPNQQYRPIQLADCVAEIVTTATTNSVYGPMNPYKDPEVRKAFFAFEKGIMLMLVAPFPAFTAKKYLDEREKVAKALGVYFSERHFEHGSGLAKARFDYSVKNNVACADIGRFEIGGTIAILLNTLPSVYWMLLIVHTVPGLLADIRAEVDAASMIDRVAKTATLDITVVKNQCPLLLSTLKESLRTHGMGTAVRTVTMDTDVDGYLLKKGGLVQIPIQVAHKDRTFWGANADSFDPRRFLKETGSGKKIPDDTGYRAFGGGKHLCPGRFFATNEILAVVALFVSRYEMRPANGKKWILPTTTKSNAVAQVSQPDFELDMEICNRAGYDEYNWKVEVSSSRKVSTVLPDDKV